MYTEYSTRNNIRLITAVFADKSNIKVHSYFFLLYQYSKGGQNSHKVLIGDLSGYSEAITDQNGH